MLQRRHYELIAKAIHDAKNRAEGVAELAGINMAQTELTIALKNNNPRFNAERFDKACGLG